MNDLIAVVGIGNTLAGDDGAGIEVVRRLEARWSGNPRVLLRNLEGDLFAVDEWLALAGRMIFVDAVAGDAPGEIVIARDCPRGFAPSFHQADIGAVMRMLESLHEGDSSFPQWEIWGIVIEPPREFRVGLSPAVGRAVERLTELLHGHLICS